MTLVRIVKDWDSPNLLRQTPGCSGIWSGISFTLEPVQRCDYMIVLNHARKGETVTARCNPHNVWAVMQEPSNEVLKPMHRGIPEYHRIYTTDDDLIEKRYIQSPAALPWHVNRDYDFLAQCRTPVKNRNLSWITSNLANWEGHRVRMRFLESIRGKLDFDLFGRGFSFIEDKWDGLAPYRYAIAVENYRNPYYWTEKISDCFLAWTMPIYCGCTRITDFFPEEALVTIDIQNPEEAIEKIREAIAGERWKKNLDAVAHARELVLNKYQLFPFIAGEIMKAGNRRLVNILKAKTVTFDGYDRIPPPAKNE